MAKRKGLRFVEIKPGQSKTIEAGCVYVEVELLRKPNNVSGFMQKWNAFRYRARRSVPDSALEGISLRKRTKETPAVRGRSVWVAAGVEWNSGTSYQIYSEVGFGSTGKVKRIKRTVDHALYAVKIVSQDLWSYGLNELNALRRVNHEHIISLVDWAEHGDKDSAQILMVLEYAPFGSLDTYLSRRPVASFLTSEGIWIIARQILEAVKHLHGHSYIHGDIKPSNVLAFELDPPIVKLADFSHSTNTEPEPFAPSAFTAPELLRRDHKRGFTQAFIMPAEADLVSAPGDIYACGILLYSIASQNSKSTESKVQERRIRDPPRNVIQSWARNAEVDDGLKGMVLAMTHANSENRPSAKQCLEMAWLCEDEKNHFPGSCSTVLASPAVYPGSVCSSPAGLTHPDFSQLLPVENRKSLPPTEVSTPVPDAKDRSPTTPPKGGSTARDALDVLFPPEPAQDEVDERNTIYHDM